MIPCLLEIDSITAQGAPLGARGEMTWSQRHVLRAPSAGNHTYFEGLMALQQTLWAWAAENNVRTPKLWWDIRQPGTLTQWQLEESIKKFLWTVDRPCLICMDEVRRLLDRSAEYGAMVGL
jgi:hypothetical protein